MRDPHIRLLWIISSWGWLFLLSFLGCIEVFELLSAHMLAWRWWISLTRIRPVNSIHGIWSTWTVHNKRILPAVHSQPSFWENLITTNTAAKFTGKHTLPRGNSHIKRVRMLLVSLKPGFHMIATIAVVPEMEKVLSQRSLSLPSLRLLYTISRQFENFEIYKDLYGKSFKRDWVAKVVFLI